MDRIKFLAERRSGIGGSDVASLVAAELPKLGLRPFKTPLEVYYSKILEPEYTEPTIEQRRGINGEIIIQINYLDRKQKDCKGNVSVASGAAFIKKDYMIAHPDGWFSFKKPFKTAKEIKYILECKTVHDSKADDWKKQAPNEYLLQCIHYAIAFDVPFVDIAGMIGLEGLSGDEKYFKIYRYERDKKLEKRIIDIEERFWEKHVLKKIPPAPITNADYNLLQIPHDKKETIIATKEIQEAVNKYNFLHDAAKKYEKEKEEQCLLIKQYMGEAYTLKDNEGQKLGVCYNKNNPPRLDKEKLKTLISEEDYNNLFSTPSQTTIFKPTTRTTS